MRFRVTICKIFFKFKRLLKYLNSLFFFLHFYAFFFFFCAFIYKLQFQNIVSKKRSVTRDLYTYKPLSQTNICTLFYFRRFSNITAFKYQFRSMEYPSPEKKKTRFFCASKPPNRTRVIAHWWNHLLERRKRNYNIPVTIPWSYFRFWA